MAKKDQLLVEQALAGQVEAFGELVERYSSLVHGLIFELVRRSDEVEDLAQEAFYKAYEQLPRLRRPARFSARFKSISARATISTSLRSSVYGNQLPVMFPQPATTTRNSTIAHLLGFSGMNRPGTRGTRESTPH